MEEQIFRKKSLDRLSSPEQLNDYLHVTSPGMDRPGRSDFPANQHFCLEQLYHH